MIMSKPLFRRIDIFDIFVRMVISMSMAMRVLMKEEETKYIR
jgi:hypothetical protein